MFYYEVKLVGDTHQQASKEIGVEIPNQGKNKDLSIGFATDDFAGQKIVGETKESVGLCGDGKIHCLEMGAASPIVVTENDFLLQTGMIIGAGYIDSAVPLNSTLLTKPLPEEQGGVWHGGGAKFEDSNDEAYVHFAWWIENYLATCVWE